MSSGPRGERTVRPAHGGRRSCLEDQCRLRYGKRVFALALGGVREAVARGLRLKLVTFTLPARIDVGGRSVEPVGPAAYAYMARRFNALMSTARVRWPMLYFRVVEEQRRGAPHYHLLVATRHYIPKRDLSRLAARCGLGRIVDVTEVRSPTRAAHYVTKYVTKDQGAVVPARFRFYSSSRLFAFETRADAFADKAARRVGWSFGYVLERQADRVLPELERIGYVVERPPEPVDWAMYLAAVSLGYLNGPAGIQ